MLFNYRTFIVGKGPEMASLLFHIIFSTKDRTKLITTELQPKLYSYIGGIVRGERGELLAIGGMADHLHILAKFPAAVSVAEMLRRIKGNSSKWIGEQAWFLCPFGWQRGYAAFSVSQSLVCRVREYIESQEQHHLEVSFQEELLALLEKHGVEYDERYIWS